MRLKLTANDRARFWTKVEKRGASDCWEWTAARDDKGYGGFKVAGRMELAHRVSFALAHGEIPDDKPCVLHACDVPPCVNPRHLFAGTNADNIADAVAKGRVSRGEKHWNAKLTANDVRAIRAAYAGGESQRSVGRRFGVNKETVRRIVKRETWRELSD